MNGNNSNIIEVIKKELQENPENFVPDLEKDRFKGYCDRWCKQKKMGEVWKETDSLFFPLFFDDGFFTKLRQISAENFDIYIEILSSIEAPYILRDILTMRINTDGGFSIILEVLKESGLCKNGDNIYDDDMVSILAPIALDVLVSHIFYSVELPSDASKYIEQIAEILQNRTDGAYLSYHYVKYLLWRDLKKEGFYDFLEILSCGFEEKVKKYFIVDGKVKVEGLKDLSDNATKDFTFTGILNTVEGTDVLLNFRTLLRYIQEGELVEQLWDIFKVVYSCDAQSFFTNDFNFQLKHFDICNLILSQKDVVVAWEELNGMVQGSLHRLSVQYYEGQAMDLRSHIYFMWAVNLQIVDRLCKEDETLALNMWNKFWIDGLAYARRFANYQEDFADQYLSRLICCYYVCFVRSKSGAEDREARINCTCMEKLISKFKEIENMPILVLLTVRMLLSSGLSWQDIMGEKYEKFFAKLFERAGELSIGQKKYEWVSSYLKKIRFVYKSDDKDE